MRDSGLYKALDRFFGIPLLWLGGLFKGKGRRIERLRGSKVLFIKFSAIGDTLLLLPYLKAAKAELGSEGRLELLCTPVNALVLRGLPYVDALHVFRPGELFKAPWRVLGLLIKLRQGKFDAVLDFDQWLRSPALLALFSGAKLRVGFESTGQQKHLAFHQSTPNHRDSHEFEQFGELFALAGFAKEHVEAYGGFLRREGLLGATPKETKDEKLVILHPGAGGGRGWQREWPWERFAGLGRWLRESLGVKLGLSGSGAEETALCAQIESATGAVDLSCVGKDFSFLVASLCAADLLVSGNTGVMHLAAGLGTPVLALHGPTSTKKWGPLGDGAQVLNAKTSCSPCLTLGFEYGCPLRPCMESIGLEEVESKCREMLA